MDAFAVSEQTVEFIQQNADRLGVAAGAAHVFRKIEHTLDVFHRLVHVSRQQISYSDVETDDALVATNCLCHFRLTATVRTDEHDIALYVATGCSQAHDVRVRCNLDYFFDVLLGRDEAGTNNVFVLDLRSRFTFRADGAELTRLTDIEFVVVGNIALQVLLLFSLQDVVHRFFQFDGFLATKDGEIFRLLLVVIHQREIGEGFFQVSEQLGTCNCHVCVHLRAWRNVFCGRTDRQEVDAVVLLHQRGRIFNGELTIFVFANEIGLFDQSVQR